MTPTTSLVELVEGARGGDSAAFGLLVERFQGMAMASALGRLTDPELARDAAQEAFIDAFLHLHQLRETRAFPGWFRRIVWKHCDRMQRRRTTRLSDLERTPEVAGRILDPSEALEAGVEHATLRRAIEALPVHERSVVALFYLADEPQNEVAEWLDLPIGTVKKRLHSARQRLRKEIPNMRTEQLEQLLPKPGTDFSRVVRWFVAVRTGDLAGAARLLDEDPTLVHRVEDWEPDEAIRVGGPVAERATPLIRAAERNDVAMLDLLLAHGARIEADCGCETRESALWAAVVTRATDTAGRLLERGADPDAASRNGLTPLHVAAIRDSRELVALLLRFGADPGKRDLRDRTAADWARAKGHESVAAELGAARPSDAASRRPSGPVAVAVASGEPLCATGIKAIDLFAPCPTGARIECLGRHGVGRNVLLAELSERALRRGLVVWAAWSSQEWEAAALDQLQAETGLADRLVLLRPKPEEPEPARRALPRRAVAQARSLEESTARPVLLVLFAEGGYEADIDAALALVLVERPPALKLLSRAAPLVRVHVQVATRAPLQARALLRRHLRPAALDLSEQLLLGRRELVPRHVRVAGAARQRQQPDHEREQDPPTHRAAPSLHCGSSRRRGRRG